VTRALLPALRAARGRIVFVNAARGTHPVPGWSAYAGSKVALRELADSLRDEEDPHGNRVTTIYPGGVDNGDDEVGNQAGPGGDAERL
jgi:NAD(P)-dependent dehydrogenase (short-subunit alcohol dehydrogenase family)